MPTIADQLADTEKDRLLNSVLHSTEEDTKRDAQEKP